jgi:signal peptidase I
MKKTILYALFGLFFLTLTAFSVHKFYVSIYQINYASEKKMLQITSRIFVDDLNDVLRKKFNKKTHLGEENESPDDVILMKKYLLGNFFIKVNGQQKSINYLSKEFEGNVIICYYNIKDVSKIKTLEVQNKVLLDLNSEQQNIIQTTIYGKKQNLLLTNENTKGMLKQ